MSGMHEGHVTVAGRGEEDHQSEEEEVQSVLQLIPLASRRWVVEQVMVGWPPFPLPLASFLIPLLHRCP